MKCITGCTFIENKKRYISSRPDEKNRYISITFPEKIFWYEALILLTVAAVRAAARPRKRGPKASLLFFVFVDRADALAAAPDRQPAAPE